MWGTVDWASYYLDHELTVLPLARHGNRPHSGIAGRGWHFCTCSGGEPLVGTTDLNVVSTWLVRDHRLNLGVVTGARSRLLVLDVDVKHVDGHDALHRWRLDRQAEGKILPQHPSCSTPSGGRHHWFRLPPDLHVPRNDYFIPGVEVKACGGLVAVPPSTRLKQVTLPDGTGGWYDDETVVPYAWDPVGGGIPEAPQWLLDEVTARRDGAGWSTGGEGDDDDKLPKTQEFLERGFNREGQRNRDVFRLAFRLWSAGLDQETVVQTVRRIWEHPGTDRRTLPWSEVHYTTMTARGRAADAAREEAARIRQYAELARTLRRGRSYRVGPR
jgi:hypothetical protein